MGKGTLRDECNLQAFFMIGDDGLAPSAEQKMVGIEIPWKIFQGLLYTEHLLCAVHTFSGIRQLECNSKARSKNSNNWTHL